MHTVSVNIVRHILKYFATKAILVLKSLIYLIWHFFNTFPSYITLFHKLVNKVEVVRSYTGMFFRCKVSRNQEGTILNDE